MRPAAGRAALAWRPERILVLKPSSMGDVIHALPAVGLLRERWPDARIVWLVNSEWRPLLDDNPDIDGVIEFPRSRFRGLAGAARFGGWLAGQWRQLRADLVVDYQGLLRSALIGRIAARRMLAGLADAREGARHFYQLVAQFDEPRHSVERYLALSSLLSGLAAPASPRFALPDGCPPALDGGLPREFIVLHPFSRGAGKSLDCDQSARLASLLGSELPVVLVGRAPRELAPVAGGRIVDLLNRTSLHELVWLMRRARAVVSVDSGPMHIAAAVNPATVGIHTWSLPAKVGPFSDSALVWKAGRIAPARADGRQSEVAADAAGVDEAALQQIAAAVRERLDGRPPGAGGL